MSWLQIESVSKSYADRQVLRQFSLDVELGENVVLLGASGSGKSTLLRMIAGIESYDQGTIRIDGKNLDSLPPHRRSIGFVLQSGGYFDSLSVRQNLESSLKGTAIDSKEAESRIRWVAQLLEIESCLNRSPNELSGGERQRMVLGRVLVRRPKLLMFDEPFNHLDSMLRFSLRRDIVRWSRQIGATCLYVTHDSTEAMQVGDRIAILMDGKIQQFDRPESVYQKPRTIEIARQMGTLPVACFKASEVGIPTNERTAFYLVRPEQWEVQLESAKDQHRLELQVVVISKSFQATHWLLQTQRTDGSVTYALASHAVAAKIDAGQSLFLSSRLEDLGWYDRDGNRID